MSNILDRYNEPRTRWWAVTAGYAKGYLSEGQACKLLDVSPIDLRESVQEFDQVCEALWQRYRKTGETVCDDIAKGVQQRHTYRHGGD